MWFLFALVVIVVLLQKQRIASARFLHLLRQLESNHNQKHREKDGGV